MSETQPEAPRRKSCCRRLVLVILVITVALGVVVAHALEQMRATEPLDFPVTERNELAEAVLTGKFKLLELPGRWLGKDAEVSLNERELNLLLFSRAGHSEQEKARVEIQGDELWWLYSKARPNGTYLNLRLRIYLHLTKGAPPVLLLREGHVGDYELGSLTRPLLEAMLQEGTRQAVARDERLARSVGFEVAEDRVRIRYPPPE